ncbi:MAG TPA: alpha/beta hydrolase [Leptospiraceae bacterium]|nr:alpha/beta hydrolase [Leptospiraceae bacterium]
MALLCAYYFYSVSHKPVLHFQENEFHDQILREVPVLTRAYHPTPWCFNNHLMLLLLLFREYRSKDYPFDRIDQLRMKDGGITGRAGSGWNEQNALLKNKKKSIMPIVVIFHTISGDEQDVKGIVEYVRVSLRWTAVVCIRRGHGNLPLGKPKINTMGSTSDLSEQLAFIQKKFPGAPLFGIGISAGSGLLARYLGESGKKSKFMAAAAISPAYDIEKAFHRIHPVYSKIMGQRLISYFLKRHYDSLSRVHGFDHAMQAQTIGEFQDRIHAIAGYKTKEEYYRFSNPIKVAKNIRTPLLILNSQDDPICVNLNVLENLHWLENLPHTMLVHTKRGSHVAYFEGWKAKPWCDRVVGDYFQAVLKTEAPTAKRRPSKKKQVRR